MERTDRIRNAGRICIAASVLWIVAIFMQYGYGLKPPGSGTLFSINQIMFSVAIAGWITGICGLLWARAAGDSWFGRSALGLFAVGWIVLLGAGILALVTGDADLPLFPIGGLTATVGGLLACVAVVGARRWGSWRRFSELSWGPHKTPRFWEFVEQFPLTPSGKVQKFILRDGFVASACEP